jgi:hypothetical protein
MPERCLSSCEKYGDFLSPTEVIPSRIRALDALKYPIDAFYVKFTSAKIDDKPYACVALQTIIQGGQLGTSISWAIPLTQELQKYYPLPP